MSVARAAPTVPTFAGANPQDDQAPVTGYGDNAPGTPDVAVDFTNLLVYNGDFGTGFSDSEAYVSGGNAVITFTASDGSRVQLESFQLGTYGGQGDTFNYSYAVDGGTAVQGTASPVNPGSPATVTLPNVISAPDGMITLTIPLVGRFDPVIDNVTFSQPVPEPALLALLALGGLGLLARPRGRRIQR